MLCLEFTIPPLPKFVTVGLAVWSPGDRHFARTFGVYDLLLVKRGTLYMAEQGRNMQSARAGCLCLKQGCRTRATGYVKRIRRFTGCISSMREAGLYSAGGDSLVCTAGQRNGRG